MLDEYISPFFLLVAHMSNLACSLCGLLVHCLLKGLCILKSVLTTLAGTVGCWPHPRSVPLFFEEECARRHLSFQLFLFQLGVWPSESVLISEMQVKLSGDFWESYGFHENHRLERSCSNHFVTVRVPTKDDWAGALKETSSPWVKVMTASLLTDVTR